MFELIIWKHHEAAKRDERFSNFKTEQEAVDFMCHSRVLAWQSQGYIGFSILKIKSAGYFAAEQK